MKKSVYAGLYDLESKKNGAVQTEVVEDKAAQNFVIWLESREDEPAKASGKFCLCDECGTCAGACDHGSCHAEQF